jgi:outer membrane immunogenic protein
VKGGAVWGRVVGEVDTAPSDDIGRATASETRLGWTVGMGYEHAFTKNFLVRIDYSYMDFGSATLGIGEGFWGDTFRSRTEVDTTVNQIKVGAAFKF